VTSVYRLVRRERAAEALSGEGARRYGGRWNPPGAAVVYAAESRALAVLETVVHLSLEARAMHFVLITLELPAKAKVERHTAARPPRVLEQSQDAGAAWLEGGDGLALVVPSVLVPQEKNWVLNVAHAQFAGVRVASTEQFSFDERLWGAKR
jgi:RES domain-containing protein